MIDNAREAAEQAAANAAAKAKDELRKRQELAEKTRVEAIWNNGKASAVNIASWMPAWKSVELLATDGTTKYLHDGAWAVKVRIDGQYVLVVAHIPFQYGPDQFPSKASDDGQLVEGRIPLDIWEKAQRIAQDDVAARAHQEARETAFNNLLTCKTPANSSPDGIPVYHVGTAGMLPYLTLSPDSLAYAIKVASASHARSDPTLMALASDLSTTRQTLPTGVLLRV
jgi:hypothetical protein